MPGEMHITGFARKLVADTDDVGTTQDEPALVGLRGQFVPNIGRNKPLPHGGGLYWIPPRDWVIGEDGQFYEVLDDGTTAATPGITLTANDPDFELTKPLQWHCVPDVYELGGRRMKLASWWFDAKEPGWSGAIDELTPVPGINQDGGTRGPRGYSQWFEQVDETLWQAVNPDGPVGEPVEFSPGEAALANTVAKLSSATKAGDVWLADAFAAPDAADMPTVTIATTSQIAGGTTIAPTTDYVNDPYFRYDGAPAMESGGAGKVQSPVSDKGISYYMAVDTVLSPMSQAEFIFETTSAASPLNVRVIVGDKWSNVYGMQFTGLAADTPYFIRPAWSGSKPRRVRIEVASAAKFDGVVVPAGGTAKRPPGEVVKRLVTCLDSYGAGSGGNTTTDPATNGTTRIETYPHHVARMLNCDAHINVSVGGTGAVYDGGGGKSTILQRVPDILAANPHIVLVGGSINDVVPSATFDQVYDAISNILEQLTSVPVVILTGPSRDTTVNTNYAVYNDAVRRAAAAYGRMFVDTLDTIKGALYNAADTVHPSAEAHFEVLGPKVYNGLDRALIDTTVAAAVAGRMSVDVTLTASPNAAAASGATVTLTATLSAHRAGVVDFYDGGSKIGTGTVTAGVATLATSALAIGVHSLLAKFRPTSTAQVKPSVSNTMGYTISANLGMVDHFSVDGPLVNTENGKAWTAFGTGVTGTAAGGVATISVTSGNGYLAPDAGTPNGTGSVKLGGSSLAGTRLPIRLVSQTNLLHLTVQTGQIVLTQVINNVSTVVGTGASGSWAIGDTISYICNGDLITIKKNGVNVTGLVNVSVPQFNTATRFGIGGSSSATGVNFDDFEFIAA